MSHFKYVESERKSRKSKKKTKEYAIFPDGDETDCSSRTTFYDVCRQSSTTTSVSEQSSTEDGNGHISENTSNHYIEETHDDVFYKLNSLTGIDRVNSECTLRTKTTTLTKISAIDITITSPEPLRSPTYNRPSCTTRIRDDIEPETSSDEFEIRRRSLSRSKKINNITEPQKIIENNMKMLPSIDVIPASPTLSVLSQRLMINREKTGSLQRSGITLSPISPRTLTPMSSLSSSSTMSDTFSLTSGSEDGILSVRSRFFNRRSVLPPIIRSSSEEKQQEEEEMFLQASIRTGKKNKNPTKCRKPKSTCFEEYRTNSCCSESITHTQKILSDFHRHNENMSQFDIGSSKKDNLYRPMNIPSTKVVEHHYKENVVNKKERVSQNIKTQKQGYPTAKDTNRADNKQNTRKKSNVNGTPCKSLLTVKDHYNKSKNIQFDPRKSLKGNQKQERLRKKSIIKKRDLLIKTHRVESVCKSISDSSDCMSTKSDPRNRSESINSFKKYSKSISDSSDCMSSRSEQTDSTYL
ncbi:uncharacterized protein LOC134695383 [Mytilus trossulus]|uniref:uncharacterized protein LOC134695383 n=1 Tax=Mytilus trossulus TaxID=6551 RepID=UPI003007C261